MPNPNEPARPTRLQPIDSPPTGKVKLAVVIGSGAALLLVTMVSSFEGKRNDPYKDIVGVMTVCYGETRVEMRTYTNAECTDMLSEALVDYAEPVLKRNPTLRNHPNQLAASVSLAYNIGAANYNKSTVAKKFSAGDWKGACDSFLAWDMAGGKHVKGLATRRKAERDICLKGL